MIPEKLIDLSHTIEPGLVTYKGLPSPIICDYLSREQSREYYKDGAEFQIGKIEMVTNTGTYIDCPFHRFEDGMDLSEIELSSFIDLDAVTVHVPYSQSLEISENYFREVEILNKAILVQTGWDIHWNTSLYYENHPYLTENAARYLQAKGAKLVGIDSHNIDDTSQKTRPVHTILLGAGILIVEHMCNLNMLPPNGYTFTAVPPRFKGVGTFPVRAFAKLNRKISLNPI